jgi:uncharacterized protein (DUF302 family)
MNRSLPFVLASLLVLASTAHAADGLIAVKSPYEAKETMNRFESNAKEKGLNIFARVDHTAGAEKVGMKLRPTEVLIFGNPKGGTPFMQCEQTVGIDLPLKALVWQDEKGQVWLGYNDPAYMAKRHHVKKCDAVGSISKVLPGLADATVSH